MNITDYKLSYEEHHGRRAKVYQVPSFDLDTVTIWAVDFILIGAVVFAHFVK